MRRHHMRNQTFQRNFKQALAQTDIDKPATPHSLRHSFATAVLRAGYGIRTVQALIGHADAAAPLIYTHLKIGDDGVRSPMDALRQAWAPVTASLPRACRAR
jgi:site-specific recombinase XerD